ncbi:MULTISPECIES: hypothetical protein [Bacillaceae]|uniref:hypothetical protein n=1 Tax=Bacillaceae TaxID=186817 RepID=UPI000B040271|nr:MULTISPECIES: hypothetical protein [Bacillaceae]MDF2067366.1 hypothetical protein [Bacillus sp. Cr_A10]
MIIKSDEDKVIYCYSCRKRTLFTRRDMNNNSGVESHCSECSYVWFEWQNRAVEREKEKWVEYNTIFTNNSI